jgi:putative flippase GtrA
MDTRAALSAPPALRVPFERVLRLARAGLAGAGATLVDLGVLALLVSGFGVSPRLASLPALVAGGVANFLGNRHFAFRAREGSLVRQAVLYTLIEVIALALNGALYDFVLRTCPGTAHAYGWVRLATSHLVFLAWSYPLWRRVFVAPERRDESPPEDCAGRRSRA